MGWRFRKSIRILPGVRINIGKKGVNSISLGKRGATLNVSDHGTRVTLGMPGTGLSYSEKISGGQTPAHHVAASAEPPFADDKPAMGKAGLFLVLVMVAAALLVFYIW